MSRQKAVSLLLQLGVALSFIYAAIAANLHTEEWINLFPGFIRGNTSTIPFLRVISLLDVLLAAWILSGVRIFTPSLIACVILILLALFNLDSLGMLARHAWLLTATLSLCVIHFPRQNAFKRSS